MLPSSLQKLIAELSKLPSIGEKSATRLAHFLVSSNRPLAGTLAEALKKAAAEVRLCDTCFHLSDQARCNICSSSGRDTSVICVVEKPVDLIAVERGGEYRGLYHVLHGLWAPIRGQGPESMKLSELIARVKSGGINEVILAMSATVEGDATALYIARAMTEFNVKTSRLAQGMPKGGELEYADEVTLSRALSGRSVFTA